MTQFEKVSEKLKDWRDFKGPLTGLFSTVKDLGNGVKAIYGPLSFPEDHMDGSYLEIEDDEVVIDYSEFPENMPVEEVLGKIRQMIHPLEAA